MQTHARDGAAEVKLPKARLLALLLIAACAVADARTAVNPGGDEQGVTRSPGDSKCMRVGEVMQCMPSSVAVK